MLNESKRSKRRETAKKRLSELKDKGYRFICTHDDGATWVADSSQGLEIEPLLGIGFEGNILHDEVN